MADFNVILFQHRIVIIRVPSLKSENLALKQSDSPALKDSRIFVSKNLDEFAPKGSEKAPQTTSSLFATISGSVMA